MQYALRHLPSSLAISAALCLTAWAADSIHVSTAGDDVAPGSADKPVATVARAIELVRSRKTPQEIVIHGGVYYESPIDIGARGKKTYQAPPSLLIRPAREADGTFENVLFDGATPITDGDPVEGCPGVFKVSGKSIPKERRKLLRIDHTGKIFFDPRYGYSFWEMDTRIRYTLAADVAAVKARPVTYVIDRKRYVDYYPAVYIHTSDGRPPADHELFLARAGVAFNVRWPNVTIQGLRFRNFLARTSSGAISLDGKDQAVIDCHAWNCGRAFGAGTRAVNARIADCTAEDVASGVKTYGKNTTVEDCIFIRRHGPFEVPDYSQDQSGIHVYYPGRAAVIRRNVVVGFQTGIFIKAHSKSYVFEHNTVVAGDQPRPSLGIGCTKWAPETVCRFNIVDGYRDPIAVGGRGRQIAPVNVASHNCLWRASSEARMKTIMDLMKRCKGGETNIVASPRFAAPAAGDYRLLPDSPCAHLAPGGKPVGALGVTPDDWTDPEPPALLMTVAPPAVPIAAAQEDNGRHAWLSARPQLRLNLTAEDNATAAVRMQLRVGDADWGEAKPFAKEQAVNLPGGLSSVRVSARVADQAGNWSDPAAALVYVGADKPALAGGPHVYANRHGVVITFATVVPCVAKMEWGRARSYGGVLPPPAEAETKEGAATPPPALRLRHSFALLKPQAKEGETYHFRLVLSDGIGQSSVTEDNTFSVIGETATRYVDLSGTDVEGKGAADAPWRTIQYAVDRSLPGDEIVVRSGLYSEPVVIRRGGIEGAPLVVRAEERRKVVIDLRKDVGSVIDVREAPHVVIDGFELRWFQNSAVSVTKASHVSVRHCTMWNEPWLKGGRRRGLGVLALFCPKIEVDHCVLFAVNRAIILRGCPDFRVTHNTATSLTHGVCTFQSHNGVRSLNGVAINNSFTFAANYHFTLLLGDAGRESLTCDYNNIALFLREPGHKDVPAREIMRRIEDDFIYYFWGQKAVAYDYGKPVLSLRDWRKKGFGKHSIMARPLYVDPWNRDFRLKPGSPNIGAGKDGANIGALDVAEAVP